MGAANVELCIWCIFFSNPGPFKYNGESRCKRTTSVPISQPDGSLFPGRVGEKLPSPSLKNTSASGFGGIRLSSSSMVGRTPDWGTFF